MAKFGAPSKIVLPKNYDELSQGERFMVRQEYVKRQKGYCYFCKMPLSREPPRPRKISKDLYPKHFFEHPVHLHHCHKTGLTLGAVHAYCNAYLWEYLGE